MIPWPHNAFFPKEKKWDLSPRPCPHCLYSMKVLKEYLLLRETITVMWKCYDCGYATNCQELIPDTNLFLYEVDI